MTALTKALAQKLVDEQGLDVVIPNIYTSIEGEAFVNRKLTSIDIPDSVTSISGGAFAYNHLTSVELPESISEISGYLFSGNQLTSLVIPNSVTSIGFSSFKDNQLTSVVIPGSVTSIGDEAFRDNQLSSVVIGDSVTSIGDYAFTGNQLSSVVIGDSVTSIGHGAFSSNKLTSIDIPDSVTSINSYAFSDNPNLQSFYVSKDATFDLPILPEGVDIILKGETEPSVVENLGNTETIRIGLSSNNEVDNFSRKIAVIHEGSTIPLLGEIGAYDEDGRVEIAGANKMTAVDAEVYEGEIYLLSRAPVAKYYTIGKYDLNTGRQVSSWDSISFDWIPTKAHATPYTGNWTGSEGLKQAFIKFREEFSFLSIPEHGTGSISSSTSEPSSSEDDIFEISSPSKFKVKNIDKITNFNPSTDTLEIDTESFGIDSSSTFAAGTNKRDIKKNLAKQDVDFLYDQKKGGLYFNENGADNGFGEGGIIAILKGAPDLTSGNLEFI